MAHTSGPWAKVAKEVDDPSCPEFLIRCGSGYIATVDSSRDENTDNAWLIAAAPDLYDACAAAEDYLAASQFPGAQEIYQQLHTAIARANGE